jgi:hypothetical protein
MEHPLRDIAAPARRPPIILGGGGPHAPPLIAGDQAPDHQRVEVAGVVGVIDALLRRVEAEAEAAADRAGEQAHQRDD